MATETKVQGIYRALDYENYIYTWIEQFIIDRRSQNLSPGTIRFYQIKLGHFALFCDGQSVTRIDQIDAQLVRRYLFFLEEQGHNPGGVHAGFRAVKAFLRFYQAEAEPDGWKDPFRRVKAPRVADEPLTPADPEAIGAMLGTCRDDYTGRRDRAIMLFLLDTGVRAAELLALDLDDVDLVGGAVLVRCGKGRKPRTVYTGRSARKALRAWMKVRGGKDDALFQNKGGQRLTYDGLRAMIKRRAKVALVEAPTLHSFRRAFALAMLRAGTDVFTLQRLMGHTSLHVLNRYLRQESSDLAEAHRRASPVDHISRK